MTKNKKSYPQFQKVALTHMRKHSGHAYIHLTDVEAAFRIQKNDLVLRPLWHQKEKRVQAHILVCFLAYVLWKCLSQMCKNSGLGNEPRKIIDEIKRI